MPSSDFESGAVMAHRCKRIIDGKTYNTETATRLAGWDETEEQHTGTTQGHYLYQNRLGAFFLYHYADDESGEELHPFTPEGARKWLEQHCSYEVELIESLFGKMPEAGSGESKFTLRLPDNLRDRLATRAKTNGQSLNAWIVRCLESCAALEEPPSKPRAR